MTKTAAKEKEKFTERADILYLTEPQIDDLNEEHARLRKQLDPKTPEYIRKQIQDPGEIRRQIAKIERTIAQQAPHAYEDSQLDGAMKREQELREQWMAGMPTQAEMGRNPVGAVDKHRAWERRNKVAIKEWKNIRRRLFATVGEESGMGPTSMSNIEMYRPRGGPQELNLHNAQIQRPTHSFPPGPVEVKNVMDDEYARKLQAETDALRAELENIKRLMGEKRGPGRPPKTQEGS